MEPVGSMPHSQGRSNNCYPEPNQSKDCNNYREISLLSTSYKILSNILLPRMTPYAKNIDRKDYILLYNNRVAHILHDAIEGQMTEEEEEELRSLMI